MIKTVAYKCEYCSKILSSYSGMNSHEKKCYKNPDSKSCITCSKFSNPLTINGNLFTKKEEDIFAFKVEGTYTIEYDGNPDSDMGEYPVLKDEYQYLYDHNIVNYCSGNCKILPKLKTMCEMWAGE